MSPLAINPGSWSGYSGLDPEPIEKNNDIGNDDARTGERMAVNPASYPLAHPETNRFPLSQTVC